MFQCRDIAFWRDPSNRHCLDETRLLSSIGIFSLITDFLILAIPISVLPKLGLRPREKILLAFLFALGTFTCIATIFRLTTIKTLSKSRDWTFNATQTAIWSIVEVHTGIICACAPHLKALAYKLLPKTRDFFHEAVGPVMPWRTANRDRYHDQLSLTQVAGGTGTTDSTFVEETVIISKPSMDRIANNGEQGQICHEV